MSSSSSSGPPPPAAASSAAAGMDDSALLLIRVGDLVVVQTSEEPVWTLYVVCAVASDGCVVREFDPDAGKHGAAAASVAKHTTTATERIPWSRVHLPRPPTSMAVSDERVFALSIINPSAHTDLSNSSHYTTVYYPGRIVEWRPGNRYAVQFIDGEQQLMSGAITFDGRSVPTIIAPVRVSPSFVNASLRALASQPAANVSPRIPRVESPATASSTSVRPPTPNRGDSGSRTSPTPITSISPTPITSTSPSGLASAASAATSVTLSVSLAAAGTAAAAAMASARKKRSFMIAFPTYTPNTSVFHAPVFQPIDPTERVLLDLQQPLSSAASSPSTTTTISSRIGFVTSLGCQHRWDVSKTYLSKNLTVAPFILKFSE